MTYRHLNHDHDLSLPVFRVVRSFGETANL